MGDILVTGGVGSVAVAVLSKLGYNVIALSGRVDEESEFLKELGASEIISRSELSEPGRPIGKERWIGVVDVVGSHVLANACASTSYGGVVTACGLAGGMDFPATVASFILRGVSLIGIDSVMCPRETRLEAWQRLERDLDLSKLSDIANEMNGGYAIISHTHGNRHDRRLFQEQSHGSNYQRTAAYDANDADGTTS